MIEYIVRMILCSCFFIAIYYGFFQNERMFLFNRFYLIFSALGSMFIPVLNFKSNNVAFEQVGNIISYSTVYINNTIETFSTPTVERFSWENFAIAFYSIIAVLLFTRFVLFNWILLNKIKHCDLIDLANVCIALTSKNNPPHSYLNYIFVSKSDYENGLIDQTIIDHERAHINQKHTLDILFVEILLTVAWFNPFFYLYRNAIRLNHEFLADETVISLHENTSQYKHLIISEAAHLTELSVNRLLSSPFNFIKTKKRLEMMTKMKITQRIVLKQVALIPLLFTVVVLFSNNSFAREIKKVIEKEEPQVVLNQTNSEEELQKAFDELLKPYVKKKNGRRIYYGIDAATQKQLIPLYEKMSESQKARQIVKYMPGLKKRVPSKDQFEKWKDPKAYGVWLDGKRISNELLNNYKNTDISYFDVSRLTKTAINYGKHIFQLNASTNADFEAYNTRLEKEPYLVFMPVKKSD